MTMTNKLRRRKREKVNTVYTAFKCIYGTTKMNISRQVVPGIDISFTEESGLPALCGFKSLQASSVGNRTERKNLFTQFVYNTPWFDPC